MRSKSSNRIDAITWASWDDVRYFVAVAQEGSLNAAARKLGVSHTTVGRRLRALEGRLEAKLFDRHDSRMKLNPVTEAVVSEAEAITASMSALLTSLRGADSRVAGEISLNASDGLSNYWLLPRLQQFLKSHPDIRVNFYNKNFGRESETDVGFDVDIRWYRTVDESRVVRKLGEIAFSVFALPSYVEKHGLPTTIKELEHHKLLQFNDYLHHAELFTVWNEIVERSGAALRLANSSLARSAMEAGDYITLFPNYASIIEPRLIRAPIEVGVIAEIWLTYNSQRAHQRRVRMVVDEIIRLFNADRGTWFS